MSYEIGKKIRLLRLSKGLTQEQLAEKLCVAPQTVSKWENSTTAPDISLLPEISVIFGVTIDELFSITDESRLDRIENLLSGCSNTIIPDAEFRSDFEFLISHRDDTKLKGRVLSALTSLYLQQSEGYRSEAAKYAIAAIECEPDLKSNHSALRMAWGGADRDWYAASHCDIISYYMDFVEKCPDNLPAHQLLLDNLLADHRLKEAEHILAKLKRFDCSCRTMWYAAKLASLKGDNEAAEKHLDEMNSLFADDWLAHSYRADFYASRAEYEKAAAEYKLAAELQPSPVYTDHYLSLAKICLIQKDYRGASMYYSKVAELLKTDWAMEESDAVEYYTQLSEKYAEM